MSEVHELIKQLKKLQLDNANAERALINQIEQLQERDLTTKKKATTVKDADGTTIRVGDKVKILTAGINRSKEGTVTEIHRKQASVRTTSGAHVRRAFHNLRVNESVQQE